jgi:hypothetical protein
MMDFGYVCQSVADLCQHLIDESLHELRTVLTPQKHQRTHFKTFLPHKSRHIQAPEDWTETEQSGLSGLSAYFSRFVFPRTLCFTP